MTKRMVKAKADQEKLKSLIEDTSRVIQDTKLLLQRMDMSVQILNEIKNCFAKWTISFTQINETMGKVSTTLRERTEVIEKKLDSNKHLKEWCPSSYKKKPCK